MLPQEGEQPTLLGVEEPELRPKPVDVGALHRD